MALVAPDLQFLTLQHFSFESIRILTESLRHYPPKYPNLQSLELRIIIDLSISTTAQIIDLLQQCPMIKQLSLIAFYSSTFIPLLKYLSHATTARNSSSSGNSPAFLTNGQKSSVLARDMSLPDKQLLLPHLSTFGIAPIDDGCIAHVCEVLSYRQAEGRAISCLKSSSFDRVPVDRFWWLRERVTLDFFE
jgi:hypothetical protein